MRQPTAARGSTDALGRSADAIPLYEQAVQYLPDADPNKKVAQERLAALKGGR